MATYTYYELNDDGSVPLFEFVDFETDAEARLHASSLLRASPGRKAVEVWKGERLMEQVLQEQA